MVAMVNGSSSDMVLTQRFTSVVRQYPRHDWILHDVIETTI